MKATFILIAFLLLNLSALGADPSPYLKSAPMPFYPPFAGQARIGGKVTLHFVVNEQGDTSDVEAVGGHRILQDAAIQNVQNWKFAWVHPCACRVKRQVVFLYSIGDWLTDNGPTTVVKWFGKNEPVSRVEIQMGGTQAQF